MLRPPTRCTAEATMLVATAGPVRYPPAATAAPSARPERTRWHRRLADAPAGLLPGGAALRRLSPAGERVTSALTVPPGGSAELAGEDVSVVEGVLTTSYGVLSAGCAAARVTGTVRSASGALAVLRR